MCIYAYLTIRYIRVGLFGLHTESLFDGGRISILRHSKDGIIIDIGIAIGTNAMKAEEIGCLDIVGNQNGIEIYKWVMDRKG